MPPVLIVLLAAACALGGAAMLLWFVIHLWVAMRMGGRLNRKDYVRAGVALTLLAGGVGVMLKLG